MYILQLSMFRFHFFFCSYSNSILQLQDGQPNSSKTHEAMNWACVEPEDMGRVMITIDGFSA